MKPSDLDTRARHISGSGLALESLCHAFDELLRGTVPYVAAAWSSHDPATGLFTSCTVTGMPKDPEREAALFRYEFLPDEPSSFSSLIAEGTTVAVLSDITGGDLSRARRHRELLSDFGVTDELRTVLWDRDVAWGSAILYRIDGTFARDEAARVAELSSHVANGMRLAMLRSAASRPEAVDDPPGILRVHADGRVTALTEPARMWLDIAGADLVTTANATAAAVRSRADWAGAKARLSLVDGRVLSLYGASMAAEDGAVAVIIDRARPIEVSNMLVDAYRLTPRQREVLGLILLGRSMTQVARELGISDHTAHDHRKAVYSRIGVSSRSELAALLQSEHYDPLVQRGASPSPYGGFMEV